MICKNCGSEFNPRETIECPYCSSGTIIVTGNRGKNSGSLLVPILCTVIAVIVLCTAALAIGFNVVEKRDKKVTAGTTVFFTDTSVFEQAAQTDAFESTYLQTTSSSMNENYGNQDGVADYGNAGGHENGTQSSADVLFRPDSSKLCIQYQCYVDASKSAFDYAQMRFGPSQTDFGVVCEIPNGETVTVESVSMNGWTLCFYNVHEGWIQTDFLKEMNGQTSGTVLPEVAFCNPIEGYVNVFGEYDGEPLNMRSGPGKEYSFITTVPDETNIWVLGQTYTIPDWIYVEYNGHRGWVLSLYVDYIYGDEDIADKPVLYLYPEKQTEIDVKIKLNNVYFSCTYPEYSDGWSVVASPDGTLINKADGKEYSYLYWELKGKQDYSFDKGFVVKGSETAEFLQEKLSQIGLTPREYNEFIVYWLPKMQKNAYNLISFQGKEYTDSCQLDINPKPDSVLRVFMAYKSVDRYFEIEEQEFEPFERKGFTVVEWGGAEAR